MTSTIQPSVPITKTPLPVNTKTTTKKMSTEMKILIGSMIFLIIVIIVLSGLLIWQTTKTCSTSNPNVTVNMYALNTSTYTYYKNISTGACQPFNYATQQQCTLSVKNNSIQYLLQPYYTTLSTDNTCSTTNIVNTSTLSIPPQGTSTNINNKIYVYAMYVNVPFEIAYSILGGTYARPNNYYINGIYTSAGSIVIPSNAVYPISITVNDNGTNTQPNIYLKYTLT